jgi:hypothetical protein
MRSIQMLSIQNILAILLFSGAGGANLFISLNIFRFLFLIIL